jgi:predicted Zn finger-like uncharacterized protein
MLLPCPHCRKQFRLLPEQIHAESATIKCPACSGLFRLNLTPQNEAPMDSRFRGNDEDTRASLGIYPRLTKLARDKRSTPRFLMFWVLVPACFVFLTLTGIFLPGHWLSTEDLGLSSLHPQINAEEPPTTSDSSQTNDPIALAFWSPTHSDAKDPCEVMRRSEQTLLETRDQDPCQLYPLWITYLILETAPTPACQVEPTFVRAMDAIQSNTLCGPGYAFLSEYYLDRRLIERAQSFLDEALRLAPNDPWVKLVEAVLHEEAYFEDPKAIQILEELRQQYPSFPLAHYLLGRLYIRREDFGKGNASFQSLKEDVKGQVAFWRIRRALSSLEKAGDSNQEKAESLLAMSRAFTTLKDFPMAEHLYRWVLREMPDSLPKKEQLAAYCELGQLYEARGDRRSAYDAYRDALDIDPEFQDARERIGRLFPDLANSS